MFRYAFHIILFVSLLLIITVPRTKSKVYIIKYIPNEQNNHLMPVSTRGETNFTQIGLLINSRLNLSLALYGKRTYNRSETWNYYTYVNNYHQLFTPIEHGGRDCMSEIGCKELMDGEDVFIANYNDKFKVKLYNKYFRY